MNAVARAQLTFQVLTLLQKDLYYYIIPADEMARLVTKSSKALVLFQFSLTIPASLATGGLTMGYVNYVAWM